MRNFLFGLTTLTGCFTLTYIICNRDLPVILPQANTAQVISGSEFRVQADSGTLVNFKLSKLSAAIGSGITTEGIINPSSGTATGVASYTFSGRTGNYDIFVAYCDEDDGEAEYAIFGEAGKSIATWKGDYPTGEVNCNQNALVKRTVASNVPLFYKQPFRLECQPRVGDPCRVSYIGFQFKGSQNIEFTPVTTSNTGAFPGVLGFGANTQGARGKSAGVCVVENTSDAGEGSFRECVQHDRPQYIVFNVAGYINLSSEVRIGSNKTIECGTAPGDGVVFRDSRVQIAGSNVILRGCRSWAGNKSSGQDLTARDSFGVGSADRVVSDVVIANTSSFFAPDETIGTWNTSERVTFQNNLVGWGLGDSGHGKGVHSMGMLIGQSRTTNVSIIGNMFGQNTARNPQVTTAGNVEVINNLIFCYGDNATHFTQDSQAHAINNAYQPCKGSTALPLKFRDRAIGYSSGNILLPTNQVIVPSVDEVSAVSERPNFTSSVAPKPALDVPKSVLTNVGTPFPKLSTETLFIATYASRTSQFINVPDEVGGYPVLKAGVSWFDFNNNGMSDLWEYSHCKSQCSPSGDADNDGYENIEEWFHSKYDGTFVQLVLDSIGIK